MWPFGRYCVLLADLPPRGAVALGLPLYYSGPFRYDFMDGRWVYHRTGQDLVQQLEQELQQMLGASPGLEE